jgi:hypothetical protein
VLKSYAKPPPTSNRFAPLSVEFVEGTKPSSETKPPSTPNQQSNSSSNQIKGDDDMSLEDTDKADDDSARSSKANASPGPRDKDDDLSIHSDKDDSLPPSNTQPPPNHTPPDIYGGQETANTELVDPTQPPASTAPVEIRLTAHEPEWKDEDSDGEAACSGDERSPPKINLSDIAPTPSTVDSTATTSSMSTLTDPSIILDPSSGQTLLSVEIQLQPDKEHLQMMFDELKNLLAYVQILDPSAVLVSRGLKPDKTPLPNLNSSKSPHWPTTYASAIGWFQSSTGYVFKQKPVSETQLAARLETRRNRSFLNDTDDTTDTKRRKAKKGSEKEDRGPTLVYVTVNLYSSIPDIRLIIESINIDLRKSNIRVSIKALQCWESQSKKMLCSVQSNLCLVGVKHY